MQTAKHPVRRAVAACVVVAAACGSHTALGGVNQWTTTGPPARVYALATDPVASGVVYVSSAEGIWRSADHAATWNLLGPIPGEPAAVVAPDPFDSSSLLAGGRSLYRSRDGGATWVDVSPPGRSDGAIYVGALRFDPAVASRVYAVSQDFGVFRSDDGGSTWAKSGDEISGPMDLVIDPADSRTLYVGTDRGTVFRSFDAGASWIETTRPGYGHNILRMALAGAGSRILFAIPYCCGDLYRSFDAGDRWSDLTLPGPQGLPTSVAVDLKSPADLYMTAQPGPSPPEQPPPFPPAVSHSADGGASWAPLTNGLPQYAGLSGLVIDSTGGYLHAIGDQGTWTYQPVGGGIAAAVPMLSPAMLAALATLIAVAGVLLLRRG